MSEFGIGAEVRVKPRVRLPFGSENHRKARAKKLVGRVIEIKSPPYDTWVDFPGMERLLDFAPGELVLAEAASAGGDHG